MVLFDLMTLCQHHSQALDSCLGPLLGDGAVLKLGFEVAGDIAKLAGSWPAVGCFRQVVGVLDLRPLFVAYGLASQHPVRGSQELPSCPFSAPSGPLSALLCQQVLPPPFLAASACLTVLIASITPPGHTPCHTHAYSHTCTMHLASTLIPLATG